MLNQYQNKIIYSMRINIELQKKGLKPILSMPNPYKENLVCWVYEETEEFIEAFNQIMEGTIND